MRKTIVLVTLLALAWLGYVAWPIYTLGTLARAIEAGTRRPPCTTSISRRCANRSPTRSSTPICG